MARNHRTLVHVDLLRGLAAVEVFVGHARQQVLVDFPKLAVPNVGAKLLFFCSSFGHAAVMVFFVMSGFFIAGSVVEQNRAGRWSWSRYALQRITRLQIVLIPALLLGAAWDTLLLHSLPYADPERVAIASRVGLGTLLGNALYLQSILVPVFGSNGPLWSLSYEFWYYVAFPLIALPFLQRLSGVHKSALFLAGGLTLVFVGRGVTSYFAIWLVGAAVNVLPHLTPLVAGAVTATGALSLGSVLALEATGRIADGYPFDMLIGLGTAWVLWGIVHLPGPRGALYRRLSSGLANVSYTLYLVHYPALLFVGHIVLAGRRWQPDMAGLAVLATVIGAGALYTWLVWRVTEAQTGRLRASLSKRLLRRHTEPAGS